MQPETRKWNLSHKRKFLRPQSSQLPFDNSRSSELSPALSSSKSTQKPQGIVLYK